MIGKERYLNDELIQTWMIHHLKIIEEAANKVSLTFQQNFLVIKWHQIIGMRNLIIYEYFGVDLEEEIWNTLQRDIPVLKQKYCK